MTCDYTCDGLSVLAVRLPWLCVHLAGLPLAHILLLLSVPLASLRVWVWVWGRGQGRAWGGQLCSPLTALERQRPWASGAGAPLESRAS